MWSMNKPASWLASLDKEKRREVINQAKRRAPEMKARFKEREESIAKLRRERLMEKRQKMKEKVEKKMRERKQLEEKIKVEGFWQTEEQVKVGLEKVRLSGRGEGKTRQLAAIKTQMAYRLQIMDQLVLEKGDWLYSQGGKPLGVAALTDKLIKVIHQFSPGAAGPLSN